MLVRDVKRLLLIVAPIVTLICIGGRLFWRTQFASPYGVSDWLKPGSSPQENLGQPQADQDGSDEGLPAPAVDGPAPDTHHELVSLTSPEGKYFDVLFNTFKHDQLALNPNFLPHPTQANTWIVVAQARDDSANNSTFVWVSAEISCNARFTKDGSALACVTPPEVVPIEPTRGDLCSGDIAYFNLNSGPHDARVLYGPDAPYTIYGSNGAVTTCFGIWMQDFRALSTDAREPASRGWLSHVFGSGALPPPDPDTVPFQAGTELSRPPPYMPVEKNWFLFWDLDGKTAYLHHDMAPRRVFARLHPDGTVGPDLAPQAAAVGNDGACMAAMLPTMSPDKEESLHQATNSLSVTMCHRQTDPDCRPMENNTVVITIVQHKAMTGGFLHAEYEPYVVAFNQTAPFGLHSISRRPLWLRGRGRYPDDRMTEMMYVTSMAWKEHGLKYHGYLDDVIMLGFGIEDRHPAGIDVLAGDLLSDMGLCSDVGGST